MSSNISLIEQYLGHPIGSTYEVVSQGWDYEVIIYEGMVYRFPKPGKIKDFMMEKQKLDVIRPYVSLPIPNYIIVDDTFIAYPVIKGKTLNECVVVYSDEFINTLVGFIKQLHGISVDQFDFLNSQDQSPEEFQVWVQSLKDSIETRLMEKVSSETISNLHVYMDELFFRYKSPKKAFVHADIQGKNIIYNEQDQKVVGIIDFTDSRVGGVELDFCHFAYREDDLLERMVVSYLGYFDNDFITRVKFLARRTVIWHIRNDDIYHNDFDCILKQLDQYGFMI